MKKTIFFFGDGRLGNQMFQIAYLSYLQEKHGWRAFAFNMAEAKNTFEILNENVILIWGNRVSRKLGRIFQRVLRFFALRGVFDQLVATRISVLDSSTEDGTYTLKKGLFSGICFCEFGFFQTEKYVKDLPLPFVFLKDIEESALRTISAYSEVHAGKNFYFVHVRLGDYADYKIFGKNSVLPGSYYQRAIDKIRGVDPDAHFLVFSDSLQRARQLFENEPNLSVVQGGGSAGFDLCLMSMCCGGVLSASSYSWWAGFMVSRNGAHKRGTIVAPNFWLGHESQEWYPRCVESIQFSYLNVH